MNILNVKQGIIVHQVNCQGVMGAGLALALRRKYPQMYTSYMKVCSMYTSEQLLGKVQMIKISDDLTICNFFAQLNYGTGKVQTNYDAFEKCLEKLAFKTGSDTPIYIPYKIGCGLAGGDWEIIKELLDIYLYDHKVIICRKEEE